MPWILNAYLAVLVLPQPPILFVIKHDANAAITAPHNASIAPSYVRRVNTSWQRVMISQQVWPSKLGLSYRIQIIEQCGEAVAITSCPWLVAAHVPHPYDS